MPGYMKDALHKFQQPTPTRPQNSPHQYMAPKYGSAPPQLAHLEDDFLALNPDEANTIQKFVRTFLYYTRAVYPTMLVALNTIAAQQSKSTQETVKKVVQLMNYTATHPETITRYHARGMTMHMHSNASFLLAPGEKSEPGVPLPQ